jgi:indole-3-glycerol phosphate synthase/phosphoribosylanthranilate isomerase
MSQQGLCPSSRLHPIVAHKRHEVEALKQQRPFEHLMEVVRPYPPEASFTFEAALRQPAAGKAHLIAELKPASPSQGAMNTTFDLEAWVAAYAQQATCLSVLTDERFFGGSFERLAAVGQLTQALSPPPPLLCKDFVLDPYQVMLAVEAKAQAVLLMLKTLPSDTDYVLLFEMVRSYGLTPVVEVQNEDELRRALLVRPPVLLINNRNLDTFEMDLSTTARLLPLVPEGTVVIAASGVETLADWHHLTQRVAGRTPQAVLVGSSLMKQPSLAALQAFLAALVQA